MKPILSFLTIGVCALSPLAAVAQGGDSVRRAFRDYSFVEQSDAWLTSANAAGLSRFGSANISRAELSARYEKGGWTNYDGAIRAGTLGADVASYYRLNGRTVVYGLMAYEAFSGSNMGGSAWAMPTYRPFDIVEDSINTAGSKHRDTYRLVGGVGVDLYRGVAIGAKIDYTSANYAKYKDLRHKNMLMVLDASAGVMVPIGAHLSVGANYRYRRETESLRFTVNGQTDRTYMSLISYGAFMGKTEQYGGSGYTDQNNQLPFVDQEHGGGLQVEVRGDGLSFYNYIEMGHRHGYYGRKSPYTITYTTHAADRVAYVATLALRRARQQHLIVARVGVMRMENLAQSYRELTNDAGATYYQYYTPVKTGNKRWQTIDVGYTGYYNVEGDLPGWTVNAKLAMMERRQTAYAYPYYRRQRLHSVAADLGVAHNLPLRHGMLTIDATVSWSNGGGEVAEDLTMATPSDKQTMPPTMDTWLYREAAYLVGGQYCVAAGVQYSFVFPTTSLHTYVRADVGHRHGRDPYGAMQGSDRLSLGLTMGCTF